MDINKSISVGLAEKGYKSAKQFCEANGVPQGKITQLRKNSPAATVASIKQAADGFGVPVSEFIKWGEW